MRTLQTGSFLSTVSKIAYENSSCIVLISSFNLDCAIASYIFKTQMKTMLDIDVILFAVETLEEAITLLRQGLIPSDGVVLLGLDESLESIAPMRFEERPLYYFHICTSFKSTHVDESKRSSSYYQVVTDLCKDPRMVTLFFLDIFNEETFCIDTSADLAAIAVSSRMLLGEISLVEYETVMNDIKIFKNKLNEKENIFPGHFFFHLSLGDSVIHSTFVAKKFLSLTKGKLDLIDGEAQNVRLNLNLSVSDWNTPVNELPKSQQLRILQSIRNEKNLSLDGSTSSLWRIPCAFMKSTETRRSSLDVAISLQTQLEAGRGTNCVCGDVEMSTFRKLRISKQTCAFNSVVGLCGAILSRKGDGVAVSRRINTAGISSYLKCCNILRHLLALQAGPRPTKLFRDSSVVFRSDDIFFAHFNAKSSDKLSEFELKYICTDLALHMRDIRTGLYPNILLMVTCGSFDNVCTLCWKQSEIFSKHTCAELVIDIAAKYAYKKAEIYSSLLFCVVVPFEECWQLFQNSINMNDGRRKKRTKTNVDEPTEVAL